MDTNNDEITQCEKPNRKTWVWMPLKRGFRVERSLTYPDSRLSTGCIKPSPYNGLTIVSFNFYLLTQVIITDCSPATMAQTTVLTY